jgi:hypothetical protein
MFADKLKDLLSRVRLELDLTSPAVLWEGRRYPVADLCLEDLDHRAEEAELLAVAAGFENAIKYPGRLAPGEDLRKGAAALLPKLERARFGRAYDAVVAGRGEALETHGLYVRDFGGGLITAYVQDEGWRFNVIPRGRVAGWDASPGTVHSVARSNLYHRQAVDHRAAEVTFGDGYDAARAILVDDVFYDRIGSDGCDLAVPGRDLLFVGAPGRPLDRAVIVQAYQSAKYPISPEIFRFRDDSLREVAPIVA